MCAYLNDCHALVERDSRPGRIAKRLFVIAPSTPDLLSLIEAGLRAKPPRGDELAPHMSDNICDLQTWYRRSGVPALPHDFRTLVKFELGHQFERGMGDILEQEFEINGKVERDVRCELNGVVGHADFVWWPGEGLLVRTMEQPFLLEIKSTSFLRGQIPAEPASWYVEQAALYATALDVARFGILVGCRESGKIAPIFWFNLDDAVPERWSPFPITWREWAKGRAKDIATLTDPSTFPPAAAPRTSWACRTCNYAVCSENKNPAAKLLALEGTL